MRKFILGAGIVVGGSLLGVFGWKTHRLSGAGTHGTRLPQAAATTFQPVGVKAAHRAPSATRVSETSPAIALQYSKLPLAFEPNVGQFNKEADFFGRGDGYSVFLTPQESVVVLKKPVNGLSTGSPGNLSKQGDKTDNRPAILRMELVGASRDAHFTELEKLRGKTNYLIGKEPANWQVNIPTYRKIEERGVYRGVDLDYYGTQRQLEYDFLVAPGANASAIQLTFQGAKHLRTDAQGDLIVSVAAGEVRLHKPVAYQKSGAQKETIAANYVLMGKHNVAFQLGKYDPNRELVIDPILSYSTYVGGSNIDGAYAIAVAPDNTAFIAGGTYSVDFPTVHQLQPNHGGPDDFYRDAFVSKLSADGSTLLYSSYIGGQKEDVAYGIAVDSLGQAYVTGTTESFDFPVPSTIPSINPLCGGDGKCGATYNPGQNLVRNGFIIKLNPEGSAPLYSGFIGYYENVIGQAVAVDNNQVAYVVGQKEPDLTPTVPIIPPNVPPPPFPITGTGPNEIPGPPAAQPLYGGGATDVFVMKISASGNTVSYSSYIGGSSEDVGIGIAVDQNGIAYLTGLTYSTDFPIVGAAVQGTNAGAGDAFFAKVNTAGGPFVYSTFLGGNGLDQGNSIVVDNAGNTYITGSTVSPANTLGFTPPAGAFQANCALDSSGVCEGDAFVAKFNASGSLNYFTYLGGSLGDQGYGIAIDTSNGDPLHPCTPPQLPPGPCAVVTGSTVSTNLNGSSPFPTTATAFQPKYGGGNADAFVTKLDPTGSSLIYSSFLGGTNTDIGYGIAVDTSGNAYVAGQTCSLDFPLANPEQPASGGNCDAFVSKVSILHGLQLNPAGLVFNGQSLGTTSQPQTITVTNGDAQQTVSTPTLSGPNASDFQITSASTCGTSVSIAPFAPSAQCAITVTFTPQPTATAQPLRKAQVNIVCSTCGAGGITYVANLTGQLSNLTLSASSLAFANQQVGATSGTLSVTATNIGTTAIAFSSITASGDYGESDDCRVPLQPTTNCVINVTFTPIAPGLSVGALTLTDSASGSPQIILLTGTGVGVQTGFTMLLTPSSAAVSAGQSANVTLLVTSLGGFNQPVTLSCAGLPRNANCEAASTQVTPTSPATPFPLTIATGLRTNVPPGMEIQGTPSRGLRLLTLGLTFLLLFWLVASMRRGRMRLATATLGFAVILVLGTAGCSSGSQTGVPAGTPSGTYQVTVVGTSGAIQNSTTLTLQVK